MQNAVVQWFLEKIKSGPFAMGLSLALVAALQTQLLPDFFGKDVPAGATAFRTIALLGAAFALAAAFSRAADYLITYFNNRRWRTQAIERIKSLSPERKAQLRSVIEKDGSVAVMAIRLSNWGPFLAAGIMRRNEEASTAEWITFSVDDRVSALIAEMPELLEPP